VLITDAKSRAIGRKIVALEPRFAEVVSEFSPCPIGTVKSGESAFASLASSILSQQLSTKAAETIIARLAQLSGGRLSADRIATLEISQLRAVGCSNTKAKSIIELAQAVTSGQLRLNSLPFKEDDEIIEILTEYHGIGNWTVEMFLIFQLGRLDIWPVGDLGVRRGWEKVFRMRSEVSPAKLHLLGETFRPYRSHLAWYCWRAHSLYS
jgi:DNA-3-methyladenine glycosylase II